MAEYLTDFQQTNKQQITPARLSPNSDKMQMHVSSVVG